MQVFSARRPRLTLQEIARLTGFNMTSTQRLTDTLQTLGFLGRNEHLQFHLEPKVLSLGYAYLRGSELRHLGETHIKDFATEIDHTVNMAVLDDLEIVFIYRYEVARFLQFKLYEGSRLPSYCTSTGKVLLASLDDEDLAERIKRMNFEPYTKKTKTKPQELLDEIARTREQGYGISNQELSLALVSAAVPLIDHDGRTVAALNISMTAEEGRSAQFSPLIEKLRAEGRRLSAMMGHEGPYPWPATKKAAASSE
ncbi:MAG: helix-turn-helix domain-containing protein [Deltaproteobacteria bacterium]|nr:helix-turn-helix domain-containing protein [Deltaproteobacteria bacterium]